VLPKLVNIDVSVLLFSLNMMLLSLAYIIRKKFGRVTSSVESSSVMNGIVRRTRFTHSSVACSAKAIHLHLPFKRFGAATEVTAVSTEVILLLLLAGTVLYMLVDVYTRTEPTVTAVICSGILIVTVNTLNVNTYYGIPGLPDYSIPQVAVTVGIIALSDLRYPDIG
jgi:hypothetical protein